MTILGFGKSSAKKDVATEHAMVLSEAIILENGLAAIDTVMDERKEDAAPYLSIKTNSGLHKLVHGVVGSIEAFFGQDPEQIRQTADHLATCETAAYKNIDRTHNYTPYCSYPPGTEYKVALAEAELLGACMMIISESMLEMTKALYKLKKAYSTLYEIQQMKKNPNYTPYSYTPAELAEYAKARHARLGPKVSANNVGESYDELIDTGFRLCFGIIQVVFSMIPPGLSKLLSAIGFKCSREDGLRLLWESISAPNVQATVALVVLMRYYDSPMQSSDLVLPGTEEELIAKGSFFENKSEDSPRSRMYQQLMVARARYPRSSILVLQQGQAEATLHRLDEAIAILSVDLNTVHMRQLKEPIYENKTKWLTCLHQYRTSATSFVELVDLTPKCHAWYNYLAACCLLEVYKEEEDPAAKAQAGVLLEKAASHASDKKQHLRKYVAHRIQQLKKEGNLVEVAVTKPLLGEVFYYWNGYSKMPQNALEKSYKKLNGMNDPQSALLQAVILRNLGRLDEGYKLMNEQVIPHVVTFSSDAKPHLSSKTPLKDWAPPAALYERAIFEWDLYGSRNAQQVKQWLVLAEKWGDDYELNGGLGQKIRFDMEKVQ